VLISLKATLTDSKQSKDILLKIHIYIAEPAILVSAVRKKARRTVGLLLLVAKRGV
jgi:hypothetical protein